MEYNEAADLGRKLAEENSEVVVETATEASPTVTVEVTGKGVKKDQK